MSHPHLCTAVTIAREVCDAGQSSARLADNFFVPVFAAPAPHGVPRLAPSQGRRDPPALPCPVVLSTGSTSCNLERARQPCSLPGLVLESPDPDPTFFFGRFFCGWICPLGTLNHFFSSLKSETKRGKQLIASNRYKPWQKTKYYLLIAVLVAALLGTGLVGWLDPFSLLVRSLGLSILPGLNYTVNAALKQWSTAVLRHFSSPPA